MSIDSTHLIPRPQWLILIATVAVAMAATPTRAQEEPDSAAAATTEPEERGWRITRSPQTDLWFHALAVVQADQPGPLALYSAEYARRIRETKRQRGVFPTMLDSLGPEIRRAFDEDSALSDLHFVPLFFPRAKPERMVGALRAVAKRKLDDSLAVGRDVRFGVTQLSNRLDKRSQRRLLEMLANVVENEWTVFYRDYWEQQEAEQDSLYEEMQELWDSVLLPYLEAFLERRRLNAGLVMPSPALGPEGRITDPDQFNPNDQVVAVQVPEVEHKSAATVFAFLKELCFLFAVDEAVGQPAGDGEDLRDMQDLQRTAAVRCGALILDFYAPIHAARYRRVFLDAVGAEESSTVAAFERVYALDPAMYERLREQIRRR